jgi:hypothetical protein
MELLSTDRTQPYGNEEKRNQIVNEQDQQEKVNPSGEDSPNTFEDNQKKEEAKVPVKTNRSEKEKANKNNDIQERSDGELSKN